MCEQQGEIRKATVLFIESSRRERCGTNLQADFCLFLWPWLDSTCLLQHGPPGIYDGKPAVWRAHRSFEEVKAKGTVDSRQGICKPAHNFSISSVWMCCDTDSKTNSKQTWRNQASKIGVCCQILLTLYWSESSPITAECLVFKGYAWCYSRFSLLSTNPTDRPKPTINHPVTQSKMPTSYTPVSPTWNWFCSGSRT